MADLMTFPKTLDEFMEQYKIVDAEQVYTNGAELVPIFRIKQWEDAHEQKKGKWIDYPISDVCLQCSCCGVLRMGDPSNYCPNCGAEMENPE